MKICNFKALSLTVVGLMITFISPLGANAQEQNQKTTEIIENSIDGKSLYISSCAACHGRGGKGDGPVAPNLKTKPTNLTELKAQNNGVFTRDRLKRSIDGRDSVSAHGSRDMPIWGNIFKLQAMEEGILQNDKSGLEQNISNKIDALLDYMNQIQAP